MASVTVQERKEHDMSDETTMRTMALPCRLTDHEVRERAHESAELLQEIDTDEESEAARRRLFKEQLEAKKTRLRDLMCAVRERTERRPVEVEYIASLHRSTMETMRRDTGEVVYSRPMTDAELRAASQASLWTEPPPTIKVGVTEPGRNDPREIEASVEHRDKRCRVRINGKEVP